MRMCLNGAVWVSHKGNCGGSKQNLHKCVVELLDNQRKQRLPYKRVSCSVTRINLLRQEALDIRIWTMGTTVITTLKKNLHTCRTIGAKLLSLLLNLLLGKTLIRRNTVVLEDLLGSAGPGTGQKVAR